MLFGLNDFGFMHILSALSKGPDHEVFLVRSVCYFPELQFVQHKLEGLLILEQY